MMVEVKRDIEVLRREKQQGEMYGKWKSACLMLKYLISYVLKYIDLKLQIGLV